MPVPPPVATFPEGSPVVSFNDNKTTVVIDAVALCPDVSWWDSLPSGRIEVVLTQPGILTGDPDRHSTFAYPREGSTVQVSVDQIQGDGGTMIYKATADTVKLGQAEFTDPIIGLTVRVGFVGRHNNADVSCWTEPYDSSQSHG
jgi:hypothetical protein